MFRSTRLWAAVVVASLALSTTLAPSARADDPPVNYVALRELYEGRLTEAQREEVFQWAEAYWTYVETGQPSQFEFSDDLMKSPLFSPLRSTRYMLEKIKVLSWSDCDQEIIRATPAQPALYAKREALKAAMNSGKFMTDPATNQDGTIEHFDLIFEPYSGADAYFENGLLKSEKLKLRTAAFTLALAPEAANDPVVLAAIQRGPNPLPFVAGIATSQLIADMQSQVPALALTCSDVPTWKSLITGQPSRADQLERKVQTWLEARGREPRTHRLDYTFHVYGSLPIIAVKLNEGYVILDGQTGRVCQVADYSTPLRIEAAFLLVHVEATSASFEYRAYNTCGAAIASFAAWTPYVIKPGDTLTPFPVVPPPTILGCEFDAATGVCTCTVLRRYLITPCPKTAPTNVWGCFVYEKTTCSWATNSASCNSGIPAPGPSTWPNLPTPPVAPWPVPIATCTTEYGW